MGWLIWVFTVVFLVELVWTATKRLGDASNTPKKKA